MITGAIRVVDLINGVAAGIAERNGIAAVVEDGAGDGDHQVATGRHDGAVGDDDPGATRCIVVDDPVADIDATTAGVVELHPLRATTRGGHKFVDDDTQPEQENGQHVRSFHGKGSVVIPLEIAKKIRLGGICKANCAKIPPR